MRVIGKRRLARRHVKKAIAEFARADLRADTLPLAAETEFAGALILSTGTSES